MKIDWKLKGSNLLKFGCSKDATVHPETCSKMVLMDCNGSQSLYDWITNDNQFTLDGSLSDWLANNLLNVSSSQIQVNATWNPNFINLTDDNSQNLGYIGNREDNPIRIPFTTTDSYGVIKVGTGLAATNGVLAVDLATTNYYGGLKLFADADATIPANGVPLKLSNGKAYVDFSGVTVENHLQDWSGVTLTTVPRVYNNSDDSFGNLNLASDYGTFFIDYFNDSTPSADRIYPIRADKYGRMYAFVNWSQPIIKVFANKPLGTDSGYVPTASNVTGKASKYLNANGEWTNVPYTSLSDTPSILGGTTVGYLVPAPSNTTTFLKSNGTWATPTDTTYDTAVQDNPSGLLNVSAQITNAAGCTIVTTADTPTIIAPVRYEEDNKIHGIVLDDLIEDISFLKALATALAPIIEDNPTLKAAWQNALA